MPAAAHIRVPSYRRREPEKEPLYQILAEYLETFLQQARTSEHHLPFHVEKEMRAYLECGVLAYGFMRARCEACGNSRAVAFSYKKRGFCTSCAGRRMADTAARLVDDVLPQVPVRQFVLSFPYEIRYRLAWDGELVSAVLAVFLRVVGRWYRRQAQAVGYTKGRCGSVTFVQRFGSSLNVNSHVHVRTGSLCFASRGFSLHAATRISADNRLGLEQLCRYVARPALAAGRLRIINSSQLSFALKTPWSDGTTHLVLSPFELLEKLAALVPPPRLNLIRYHGILAPSARDRAEIVPGGGNDREAQSESTQQPCPHRLSWCQLLARVFSIDVTECPDCGGQMRIIAALTDRASIRTYLEGVGLPARPPPIAQARPSQQSEFEYAA